MIKTELIWSSDISQAPRGETVTSNYFQTVKGEQVERTRTDHVPAKILALTSCGKVVQTHWIPEARSQSGAIMRHGHWSGFPEKPEYGGGPELWAPWPNAAEIKLLQHAISTHPAAGSPDILEHSEIDA